MALFWHKTVENPVYNVEYFLNRQHFKNYCKQDVTKL